MFILLQKNSITRRITEAVGEEFNLAKIADEDMRGLHNVAVNEMCTITDLEIYESKAVVSKLREVEKEIKECNDHNSNQVEIINKARELLKNPCRENWVVLIMIFSSRNN